MENINPLASQLVPKDSSAIENKVIASASQQTSKLMEMTQETVPPPANLGKKIDLKV